MAKRARNGPHASVNPPATAPPKAKSVLPLMERVKTMPAEIIKVNAILKVVRAARAALGMKNPSAVIMVAPISQIQSR